MKIRLLPDVRNEFPQWIRLAKVLTHQDVIETLMYKAREHGLISFDDADDAIIGLFAWRDIRDFPSASDAHNQAKMFDLNEIASVLELDMDFAQVAMAGARLEQLDYIMHDDPPQKFDENVYFAYLNRAGLERGLSVLGRMYEERIYTRADGIPSAFGIVSRDHNKQHIAAVVNYTNQAIEVIRSSNTIGSDEKQIWLSHLETGLTLISKPKVYLSAISLLLLQPLYSAYSSVIEDSAKPVIEAALHAIKALIGL